MNSVTTPFRLLNLPLIVFQDVVRKMDLTELLPFSLCSGNAHRFVKSLRLKLPYMVLFPVEQNPGEAHEMIIGFKKSATDHRIHNLVFMKKQENLKDLFWDHEKIEVPFLLKNNRWETYWENPEFGLIRVVEHFFDVFIPNFHRIVLRFPLHFPVLNALSDLQMAPVQDGIIHGSDLQPHELLQILQNFHGEHLEIAASTAPNLSFPENFNQKTFKSLKILFGNWIKVQNLWIFGNYCEEIGIVESKLTPYDANNILKQWIKGKMPALKFLLVECKNPVLPDVMMEAWFDWPPVMATLLDGLEENSDETIGEKQYESYHNGKWNFPAGQGLRRNDGTKASYHVEGDFFRFAVWPKDQPSFD